MPKQETILCACGCGGQLNRYGKRQSGNYYERRFIHGHNGRKHDGKTRRTQYRSVTQEFITCACGCGEKLERFHKVKNRNYWLERAYVHNHHARGKKLGPEHKKRFLGARYKPGWNKAWRKGMRNRRENPKWQASVGHEAMRAKWDKRGRSPLFYFQCAFCGAERETKRATKEKTNRFCGNECKWKFHRKENHPRYSGGIRPYPYEWTAKLRGEVKKRDGYTCQHCGSKNKRSLVVHHRDNDKQNCALENLQTLCRRCHTKEHWRMSKAKDV